MKVRWMLNDVDEYLLEELSESPYVQENWGRKPLTKRSLKKHLKYAVERARFTGAGRYDLGIQILKENAEVHVSDTGILTVEYSGKFYENFRGTTQTFYSLLERDLMNWKDTDYTIELEGKNINVHGFLAFDDANRKANEYLRDSKTASSKKAKTLTAKDLLKEVSSIKRLF